MVEHQNEEAPMSRFTIKNEPDAAEQSNVKKEGGGIKSPIPLSLTQNSTMVHNTSIMKDNILTTENIEDSLDKTELNAHKCKDCGKLLQLNTIFKFMPGYSQETNLIHVDAKYVRNSFHR